MLAARDFTHEMDSDLMAFDDFFGAADDLPDDLWSITRPQFDDDADMLDADDLQLLEGEDDKSKIELSSSDPTSPVIKAEPLPSPANGCCNSAGIKEEAPREPSLAEKRRVLLSSASPALLSSPRAKRRISETNTVSEYEESDGDAEHHECDDDEDYGEGGEDNDGEFFLDDVDYENLQLLSDEDVAALVPSPTNVNTTSPLIASPPMTKAASAKSDAMPRDAPVPSSNFASENQPSNLTSTVSEQDIPDVVNLFNSLYSPSTSPTRDGPRPPAPSRTANATTSGTPATTINPTPLRIVVPAPAAVVSSVVRPSTVLPFTAPRTANGAAAPSNLPGTAPTGVFEYFSPQGFAPNAQQSHPNMFLAAADSMSPALKASLLQGQMNAAAAMAMANSAAALNTIRKLNTTYGVPIAPLQRSLTTAELPLKPKISTASAIGTAGKVTKISITPDIADFKLVQIFHNFCDPMTKMLTLPRFHQLLLHHQVKEDTPGGSTGSRTPGRGGGATPNAPSSAVTAPVATPAPAPTPSGPGVISTEAQHLFRLMDPTNSGLVDLERFMSSFQICNRCTEAKRRAHSAMCAQQGQSFVPPTALERQLMEDVAPVIVRVVPTKFEGSKVKSCEHYQWTWCEGFDKTGNEKCRGTNRHDKCPKYLANCTLWKHKLPPKTRKPRSTAMSAPEVLDSPSKKLKHFG